MANKISIYLNIYDFTTINNCLGVLGFGGYHTGVQLKGIQLCYLICDSDLEKSGVMAIQPETADFRFNRKLFLGQIIMGGQQLEDIVEELAKKYTCGKYHLFQFNCNHFSNELVLRLLGKEIPSWIFRATNVLKFVCCCLPEGLVSGKWAVQLMQKQLKEQQQQLKKRMSNSTKFQQ